MHCQERVVKGGVPALLLISVGQPGSHLSILGVDSL
jgi:hypothetical protein